MKLLLQDYFIEFLLTIGLYEEKPYNEFVFMLLTNLTLTKENTEFVYKCFGNDIQIEKFVQQFSSNEESKWDYIGSFISNLTILKDVRFILLNEENQLLEKLYPYLHFDKSLQRKMAVCRIVKNCLFEIGKCT